ncbi:actin remodeling regulator NHS-like isoform X2 [Ornithodoros turicata]|uniref:actin remodeling regulator NHS-like isoform X2 n=1 Tax=Ornithodoros turicata TaxID=34597 RepID=UPI003139A27B
MDRTTYNTCNCQAVGDLTKFSQVKEHYKANYVEPSNLFTPETRPARVREMYDRSTAKPPLHVIRCLDETQGDVDSRCLYLCMPIWGDAVKRRLKTDLEIEARKPASLSTSKEATGQPENGEGTTQEVLPSPEEKMHALSLEYPSVVVPIDTSGSNFSRMSSVRRSLIHVDFLIKRKKHHKRRNTISDGNSKELEEALSTRRKSGNVVKTEALIHTSCQTDDELLQTVATRRSKRRSEGSPSSGDLSSSSTENNKSEKRSSFYEAMNFKLGRDWKFLKKSSKKDDHGSKSDVEKTREKGDHSSGTEKKRRSFLPISTSSAAMTVAVKLRENSARTGAKGLEDGQSSSGNWSASSSTRASVDSDQQQCAASPVAIPHSQSDSSLGKDSLFSDHTHHDTDGRSHDGTTTGYMSDASAALTATTLASSWKPGLGRGCQGSRANTHSTDQDSQSGTLTPEAYQSDSKSSSSPGPRKISIGSDPFHGAFDDGDSSVYSVDTDGYYTSMHTDSGLKYGKAGAENEVTFRASGNRGSQTSIDTIGNLSLNSFLSQNADATNDTGSICSTSTLKTKVPPVPPPRVSSTRKLSPVLSQKESSPPPCAGDISESEGEVGERLRNKTSISSFRYPSICAVSPVPSDEEGFKLDVDKQSSAGLSVLGSCEKGPNDISAKKDQAQEQELLSTEKEDSPPRYNMYGVQSPRKMLFLNATLLPEPSAIHVNNPPMLESFSPASDSEPASPCHQKTDVPADHSTELVTSHPRGISTAAIPQAIQDSANAGISSTTSSTMVTQNLESRVTTAEKNAQKPNATESQHWNTSMTLAPTTAHGVSKSTTTVAPVISTPVSPSTTSVPHSDTTSQTPTSPSLPSSPSYMPFYLNRPTSLMCKTRSPFLSYLERKSPSPVKSSTPSPPSPAKSPGIRPSALNRIPSAVDQRTDSASPLLSSSPETSPKSSSLSSPQATTPPAVPPPPPPLTYDSRVLEQGSARLPSVTNEVNSLFGDARSLSRSGARVTLDAAGKVIYSSNSLGRQHDGDPVNYFAQPISSTSPASSVQKYATLPHSLSPVRTNLHAYVKLDPAGKVESHSSSTLPRTRYSTSTEKSSPERAMSPTILSYDSQQSSRCSTPSSFSRTFLSSVAARAHQQQEAGRGHMQGMRSPATNTPVQRTASANVEYSSRALSTPVPQATSSGRSTPVHHFTPINVPRGAPSGSRSCLPHQPSPQQPIAPGRSSGLPHQPVSNEASATTAGYSIRHSYSASSVPQVFDGRMTPTHRYTPQVDSRSSKLPSASRGYPLQHSSSTSSLPSQSSGRISLVQSVPSKSSLNMRNGEHAGQNPAHIYQPGNQGVVVNGRLTPTPPQGYRSPSHQQQGLSAVIGTFPENQGHTYMSRNPAKPLFQGSFDRKQDLAARSACQNNNMVQQNAQVHWGSHDRPKSISSTLASPVSESARSPPPYGIAVQRYSYADPRNTTKYSNNCYSYPTYESHQPLSQSKSPVHCSNTGMQLTHRGDQSPQLYGHVKTSPHRGAGEASPPTAHPNARLNSVGLPHYQNATSEMLRSPQRRPCAAGGTVTTRSAYNNPLPGLATTTANNRLNHVQMFPGTEQSPNERDCGIQRHQPAESPMMLSSTSLSSSESDKSPDNTASNTSLDQEPRQKPMSTEDLFAAIHTSKRRHGIKIESDVISPLSSRSSSPSVGRPGTPSKGGVAETGFLSPRGARDRSSWSGDVRTCSPHQRRSLANDRLGPAKPTSLLDFKKLLLQTKTSSKNGQEKISAVELLKTSSPVNKSAEESSKSLVSSPVNPPSPGDQAWTTVAPLKRGRVRSSLQYRYDHMCPPILEDCLEELPEGKTTLTKSFEDASPSGSPLKEQKPSSSTWV